MELLTGGLICYNWPGGYRVVISVNYFYVKSIAADISN